MSQENQSCLRFSLEESLWFRKGQEVEELVSISLDPDITIQENEQYVTIRGSLVLSGEYKSFHAENNNENENVTSQKFVESVEERGEEECEFSHRFPVDITIPNNRIQSIYDIDVLVDSFDYSLPERSCIKLSAELTISGLYGAQQEESLELELEPLHRSEDEFDEQEHQEEVLFEAEARKELEEESVDAPPNFPTFNFQPQVNFQEPSWYNGQPRSEGYQPPVQAQLEENVVVIEEEPVQDIVYEEEVSVMEESSSSSPEEVVKGKKKKLFSKQKSMSLTEFFARKDDRAEQAKLKVCIVQKGDTVESLADRYSVTVQNLLRVNRLELNQDVYEGQVLYIPAAFAKN